MPEKAERPAPARAARAASPTTVLGIDPGTRRLGWGVVRREGTRLVHVAHGVIAPAADIPLARRLVTIERELAKVLEAHTVDCASVESIFFGRDAQAAAKLGHARGVALLVCARAGLEIHEYPPSRAKRTVTGSGKADKPQVALMVKALLRLPALPPADAADALALSVTHLQRGPVAPMPRLPDARFGGAKSALREAVNRARRRAVQPVEP